MANRRTVYKNDEGQWVNKRDGATRAGSTHDTQHQAIDAAWRRHPGSTQRPST